MIEIFYSPKFSKMYRRLALSMQQAAEEKELIFRSNPFDPQLDTHKLGGKLKGYWAFSIGYQHRIIFSFASKHAVHFHAVGPHDIYQRFSR